VIVVGAGVVGLSVGVRLAEAGFQVDVLARDLPLETTSSVAAAIWYPYLALPLDRVLGWSTTSYAEFARLAAGAPDSGVRMRAGTELLRAPTADPWWIEAVAGLRRTTDLPDGYRDGWSFEAPVVDMGVYLPWLRTRLQRAGGTLTRLALGALPERPEVVVNCSGLGARRLAKDPSVRPVRGQVVRVEQWGLERWWLDEDGPTYVVPRLRDVVVGGSDEADDWDSRPRAHQAEAILQRARTLVPELVSARVVGHRVGLRPVRSAVRLEAVRRPAGGTIVHCYGHGGAGVTLSWGCADEVLALVREAGG
jgi:D-amino-acid oxidase